MNIIPYIRKYYRTELKPEEIKSRIDRRVAQPDPNGSYQKAVTGQILEGQTTDEGFVVVKGRSALAYSKIGLLPCLIGKLERAGDKATTLDIKIQPSQGNGLIIIAFAFLLAVVAVYIAWSKSQTVGVVVPTILVGVIYLSVVSKFNQEKKAYLDFIEKDILGEGTTANKSICKTRAGD